MSATHSVPHGPREGGIGGGASASSPACGGRVPCRDLGVPLAFGVAARFPVMSDVHRVARYTSQIVCSWLKNRKAPSFGGKTI